MGALLSALGALALIVIAVGLLLPAPDAARRRAIETDPARRREAERMRAQARRRRSTTGGSRNG